MKGWKYLNIGRGVVKREVVIRIGPIFIWPGYEPAFWDLLEVRIKLWKPRFWICLSVIYVDVVFGEG